MASVEVLIGDPPCPGCEWIAALAERMMGEYGDGYHCSGCEMRLKFEVES